MGPFLSAYCLALSGLVLFVQPGIAQQRETKQDFATVEAFLLKGGGSKRIISELAPFRHKFWKEDAKNEVPEALVLIGRCCYWGIVEPQSYSEAFAIVKKAADKKFASAEHFIGNMYQDGLGVKEDSREALRWHMLAAKQNYAWAQTTVGDSYLEGTGGHGKDAAEAAKWYMLAAKNGHSGGQRMLAWRYYYGDGIAGSDKEAVMWMRRAADTGNPLAQIDMGYLVEIGAGDGKPDQKAAYSWYKKAAEQGTSQAQFAVGQFHDKPLGGFEKDRKIAFTWYKKSADQGHAEAMFKLAIYLLDDLDYIGIKRDQKEAMRWMEKAAQKNSLEAIKWFAENFEEGILDKKDPDRAFSWHEKAAALGDRDSRQKIEAKSRRDALTLLEKKANSGDLLAALKLASMHEEGNQAPFDPSKSLDWYKKAADLGSAEAFFKVGLLKELPFKTLPMNRRESVDWYKKSFDKGYSSAAAKLALMYENGIGVSPKETEAEKYRLIAKKQLGKEFDAFTQQYQDLLEPWEIKPGRSVKEIRFPSTRDVYFLFSGNRHANVGGKCPINRAYGYPTFESSAIRSFVPAGDPTIIRMCAGITLLPEFDVDVSQFDAAAQGTSARAYLRIMRAMEYDTICPAYEELLIGAHRLRDMATECKVHFVSANIVGKETNTPVFPQYREVEHDKDASIVIIGISAKNWANAPELPDVKLLDPTEAARQAIKSLPVSDKKRLIVLLTNLNTNEIQKLLQQNPQIDMVFTSCRIEYFNQTQVEEYEGTMRRYWQGDPFCHSPCALFEGRPLFSASFFLYGLPNFCVTRVSTKNSDSGIIAGPCLDAGTQSTRFHCAEQAGHFGTWKNRVAMIDRIRGLAEVSKEYRAQPVTCYSAWVWPESIGCELSGSNPHKELEAAIRQYQQVTNHVTHPRRSGSLSVYHGPIGIHLALGQLDDALAVVNKAIEDPVQKDLPNYFQLLEKRAVIQAGRGEWAAAERDLLAAINKSTLQTRRDTDRYRFDYQTGIKILTRRIESDKSQWQLWSARGTLNAEDGSRQQIRDAVADFTKALELKPGEPTLVKARAVAMRWAGQYKEAFKEYEKFYKDDKHDEERCSELIHLAQMADLPSKAISYCSRIIDDKARKTGLASVLLKRADCYEKLKKWDEAKSDYDRVIADQGNSKEEMTRGYEGRRKVFVAQKKYEVALGDITKAIELDPASSYYLTIRGDFHAELGDLAKAEKDFVAAFGKRYDPGAARRLILLWSLQGKLKEIQKFSAQIFEQDYESIEGEIRRYGDDQAVEALMLMPTCHLEWTYLKRKIDRSKIANNYEGALYWGQFFEAVFHFRTKNYENAAKLFENEFARSANDKRVHFFLGMTYLKLGRKDEALKSIEQARQVLAKDMQSLTWDQRAVFRLLNNEVDGLLKE